MHEQFKAIIDSAEAFLEQGHSPTANIFRRPMANKPLTLSREDILRVGIATKNEIADFIGNVSRYGVYAFDG
jgi:hypothetical protein